MALVRRKAKKLAGTRLGMALWGLGERRRNFAFRRAWVFVTVKEIRAMTTAFKKHLLFPAPLAALALAVWAAVSMATPQEAPEWKTLEPGLELAEFPATADSQDRSLTVLRVDPAFFRFRALSVSAGNGAPLTARDWALRHGLVAAVNASMYLPDYRTSTGYLRDGRMVNNSRFNKSFGAFFTANPKRPGDPEARLLDRAEGDWRSVVENYDTVVQNYRLIGKGRVNAWGKGKSAHSQVALGMDGTGRVLLLHCRAALTIHGFGGLLLKLPLDLTGAMYLEGGPQASLYIRSRDFEAVRAGEYHSGILDGADSGLWPLPNVLGVARKEDAKAPAP
jgi:uncharacterized protein YigE (DUF2233 family)